MVSPSSAISHAHAGVGTSEPRKHDEESCAVISIQPVFLYDRDYGTSFHLELNSLAAVMEVCCGDLTFDPGGLLNLILGRHLRVSRSWLFPWSTDGQVPSS